MVIIPFWGFEADEEDDGMNILGKRNIDNTDKRDYNCGGYAMNVFSWYMPFTANTYDLYCGKTITSAEELNAYLWECVQCLLIDFAYRNIRIVNPTDKLAKNEYLVAFRVSSDGDFHFVKRCANGVWRHKRGNTKPIHTMTKQELYSKAWCDRYDSETIFFALNC